MMRTHLGGLAVLTLLSAPAAAQSTEAAVSVVDPCTHPAPPGSLVAEPIAGSPYLVEDGLLVIEVESLAPNANWVAETDIDGYTGSSYFRWNGPDHFGSPPSGPTLKYEFEVVDAGSYRVRIRNRHDHPDSSLENDLWMSVDGASWKKAYNNAGQDTIGVWNWEVLYDPGHNLPAFFWQPGVHTIELKGRSKNFKIDRLQVHKSGHPDPLQTSWPESPTATSRPILGGTMSVLVDDPTNAAGLTPGLTFAGWFTGVPVSTTNCGTTLPGLGPFGGPGEVLVDATTAVVLGGPALWGGPGNPVHFQADVPNEPTLIGKTLRTQALFLDTASGASSPAVVTQGLDLVFGDQ